MTDIGEVIKIGFAVEMFFDSVTEAKLAKIWEDISDKGISSVMPNLGSRPHISLAVIKNLDPVDFYDELKAFAQCSPSLQIHFSAIGTFPGIEGVIFLAPVVTTELIVLHKEFYNRLAKIGVSPSAYYSPGNWVPHCTMAIDLPAEKIPTAVDFCRVRDIFIDGRLVEIGLIEYRPAREHYTFPLSGVQS